MPGEQLPPVIASLEGDDSDFLAMLDRDVAAIRSAAAQIEAELASLDLGAGLADSLSGARLPTLNTDEITQALTEQMGGVGEAIAQDLGAGLNQEVAAVGVDAGNLLAEGLAAGASGAGDAIGRQFADEVSLEASTAGARAGEALTESLTGSASSAGQQVAAQFSSEMSALPAAAGAVGASAGHALSAGVERAMLALAGAAIGAVSALGGVSVAIESRLADALMQAGQGAGGSLIAGISVGAAGDASRAASTVGNAIEASLGDVLTEAGAPAGDALMAGVQAGARSSAPDTAVRIGEALQASIETQMTLLGQLAGDAFNAGFGETGGPGLGAASEEGSIGGIASQPVQSAGGAPGQVTRIQSGGAYSASGFQIPYGGVLEPDELLGMLTPEEFDPLVPDIASGIQSAFVRASSLGLQAAVAQAKSEWGPQLAELVPSVEQFVAMPGRGIAEWVEEVQAQIAEGGPALADAFANTIHLALGGIDWSSLTEVQGAALMAAIRGEFTGAIGEVAPEAEAEMEALGTATVAALQEAVASTGSAVADALIAKIVEARQAVTEELVQLAVASAEEGEEAGGRFATFFSQAVNGIRLVFAKDPEKAAEAGAEAGRDYANALVDELEAQLGILPEVAADEGEASGSAFGRFFSGAASSVLTVFAKDPAAAAGAEAGSEFGDAMVAQLEARLAEIGAGGDAAFAQLVEQQLETQLALAAAEATAAYEQQLEAGLVEAQLAAARGLDTIEGQLDAVFDSIYQHGTLMSSQLAGAMTNALAGIEADTTGFTTTELAQWDAFFTTLEERGTTAAYQLAVSMGSMQGKDLVGMGLGSTGLPLKQAGSDAEALAGGLGGVEKAASGATAAFGGMSSMMTGPWGMAAFAAMSVLPMLSGMFESTAVTASEFTSAVQQDSNAVGDNTAATIQGTLAKSNLADISKQLGLSQAQLIEYAAGEADVQQTVNDAYNKQVEALTKAAEASNTYASTTSKNHAGTQGPNTALLDLEAQKQYLDQVTSAVQKAVQADADNSAALLAAEQTTAIYTAAVNALGQAQLLQVQQTKMQNEATAEYGSQVLFAESSVSYMTAAMGASVASARESALTNAYASVGLLNLGSSQNALNAQLAASETSYTEAQQGANAYNAVLTSLNGTTSSLLSSEASFTTSLSGLTGAIEQDGRSLDVNNAKGAANIQTMTQIATAAQQAAVAVYQNDDATGKSSQAYQDATAKLEQEKEAFIAAADKAGYNKNQVQALANELFKLPPNIQVDANVQPALNSLKELVSRINTSSGTVSVYENSAGYVGSTNTTVKAHAEGGFAPAGELAIFGENGPELGIPTQDMQIIPAAQTQRILSGDYNTVSANFGAGTGTTVNNYYVTNVAGSVLSDKKLGDVVRTVVLQFANRNSANGLSLP